MNHGGVLAAAKEDLDAVSELTRALVRIPSRAGIDPYGPIVDLLSSWMQEHGLATEIHGDHAGPRWVLDSAPFGDENAWTHPPTSGIIENG